jgi:Monooxygenase af470-like
MKKVIDNRMAAEMDGEFVVFLIGMRINKPWKPHKYLPVFLAMPKMLKELQAHPESGFLGHSGLGRIIVQYWRSFEHLEAYARSREKSHWPAWIDFNRRVGHSRGDVGIWHETYVIKPGHYEAIYSGMPPFGLGKVGNLIPAVGNRDAAQSRMRAPETSRNSGKV